MCGCRSTNILCIYLLCQNQSPVSASTQYSTANPFSKYEPSDQAIKHCTHVALTILSKVVEGGPHHIIGIIDFTAKLGRYLGKRNTPAPAPAPAPIYYQSSSHSTSESTVCSNLMHVMIQSHTDSLVPTSHMGPH